MNIHDRVSALILDVDDAVVKTKRHAVGHLVAPLLWRARRNQLPVHVDIDTP